MQMRAFPHAINHLPTVSQKGTWKTLKVATKNHQVAHPQGTFVTMEPVTDLCFWGELSYEIT